MQNQIEHYNKTTDVGETLSHILLDQAADYVELLAQNLGLMIRIIG